MKTKQPICITRLFGLLFLATGLMTGACTSEMTGDEVVPPTEVDTGRREVLLTLKNKLALPGSVTRGIATTAENELSTLDVYVFGSETENGTYTFQECFSYRGDDAGNIPNKSTNLPLAVDGNDDSRTTGLLGLKKGLYVKLYCVANTPELVDPATGNKLTADDFTGLKLKETAAGVAPALQTPGIPTETDFLKYHTPVLTEAVATDILATPLAMSGAYTTPIDLSDPESASRLNIGFKLTRMVSRFDVVNKAAESRFTIKSISMGKGRRGATFFPIAVCDAQATVTSDKLITYPERPFDGAQANLGLQEGAFYTYASPEADGGYLILKGDYQVNATEQKEVTYQVPFRQLGADGKETYLEIQHNHRYTINITKADEYHLDFNLKVEDWADDGSVDDYVPENKPGEITLGNKDNNGTDYELDAVTKKHTVKMSLVAGSNFEAKVTATSALQVTKSYAGAQTGQQYDWLQIGAPVTTFAAVQGGQMEYTYNFTLTQSYAKGRFPRATVRFFDPISGNESVLYIEAIAAPTPIEATQPSKAPNGTSENPNAVDLDILEASLYRITNSQVNLTVSCADEVELESSPTWLTVTKTATQLPKTTYSVVLNDRDVVDLTGKVVFHNMKKTNLKTEYTIKLIDAPILPKFNGLGTGNSFTLDGTNITLGELAMNIVAGNKATVVTTPMDGVTTQIDFDGGPEWLKSSASAVTRAATAQQQVVTFSLQEDKLAGAKKATVTLINKIGGKNEVFTISPKLNVGTIEKVSSLPIDNTLSGTNMTIYKLPVATSEMKLKVTSYGGSVLTTDNDNVTVTKTATTRNSSVTQDESVSYYTLTPNAVGTTKLLLANRTDPNQNVVYTITVADPAIVVTGGDSKALIVQNNQSVSFNTNSPLGFTAEANYGGTRWVNSITTTDYAGGAKSLTVSTPSSGTVTDPATPKNIAITLKNKIKDGGDKVITVTPSIITTLVTLPSITLSNIIGETNGQSSINWAGNGYTYTYSATSNNTNVATVSITETNKITVYAKRKGTATITVRTTSGASYPVTFTATVKRSYEDKGIHRSLNGNYFIAPENATDNIAWTEDINKYCSSKFGSGWYVPTRAEMLVLLGTSDTRINASVWIRDTYNSKGIFVWGKNYHTRERVWADNMWYYYYLNAQNFATMQGDYLNNQITWCVVRCITDGD